MKIAFFDTHRFEKGRFEEKNAQHGSLFEINFIEARLTTQTAILAKNHPVVCAFANDLLNRTVLELLAANGTKLIALRSAGYNHVDLRASKDLGLKVVRVPAYSPHAVAEHALCLILALNRKIHRSYQRVKELNFSIDGLVGYDLYRKTVGVLGTGQIGSVFAKIMFGLGCQILGYDIVKNRSLSEAIEIEYVTPQDLFKRSDIISLHVPLKSDTRHIIDANTIKLMKTGVVIINTGRGALIDTRALIDALKKGQIGGAGLDVYEEEEGIFFSDLSERGIDDDQLARLLTFPNVLITAHQGFLTNEALNNIAETTIKNIIEYNSGEPLTNEVKL